MNYRVKAEFFEKLMPIQQKGKVPKTLQDKIDEKIAVLLKQGDTEKLEDCSNKYFDSPIIKTVKKVGQ